MKNYVGDLSYLDILNHIYSLKFVFALFKYQKILEKRKERKEESSGYYERHWSNLLIRRQSSVLMNTQTESKIKIQSAEIINISLYLFHKATQVDTTNIRSLHPSNQERNVDNLLLFDFRKWIF